MNASRKSPARAVALIVGPGLAALGILSTYYLLVPRPVRTGFKARDVVMLFGPCFCVLGGLLTLKGFAWRARITSRHVLFGTGLVLVALGAYPWAYTPVLTGESPDSEAATVIGTMLFLLIGLPGMMLTIVGGVLTVSGLVGRSRRRAHRDFRAYTLHDSVSARAGMRR